MRAADGDHARDEVHVRFAESEELYTLVETAKVSGVDPIAYLVEAATRAKRSAGAGLLPADFKAAA